MQASLLCLAESGSCAGGVDGATSDARVIAFVMAGGQGVRLRPFTDACPKPALPFGGSFRIIDFVLSNLYNSGVPQACVLLQYQPRVLARHLAQNWGGLRSSGGEFVRPLLPDIVCGYEFRGTADAVARSLQSVDAMQPDVIAVFAADHVYRMDVRQMVAFHQQQGADASVAAVPVAIAGASAFGVICADADGRIRSFQEKPSRPEAMPGDPAHAYASMGNYLFRPAVLRAALADAQTRGEHDFGRHVLPRLVDSHRVFAYDFARNVVPGVRAFEERPYWRDVGAVDAYVEAQWDLLGPEPRFCLDNPQWPIRCGHGPRVLGSFNGGAVVDSIVAPGVPFLGAAVRHSVLQQSAHVEPGADLERCVVMEDARIARGVELRDAIVGGGNTLTPARCTRQREWSRSPAGVTIVPPRSLESRFQSLR